LVHLTSPRCAGCGPATASGTRACIAWFRQTQPENRGPAARLARDGAKWYDGRRGGRRTYAMRPPGNGTEDGPVGAALGPAALRPRSSGPQLAAGVRAVGVPRPALRLPRPRAAPPPRRRTAPPAGARPRQLARRVRRPPRRTAGVPDRRRGHAP